LNDESQISPALRVRQLALVMRVSRALYAAASLGIADILAGGPQSSAQLAAQVGTPSSGATSSHVSHRAPALTC
jgi:hypothetical protein